MGRIESAAGASGIPVIDKGIEGAEVSRGFCEIGIPVSRGVVYDIRGGWTSGERISDKLLMVEISGENVEKKDEFYKNLASIAIEERAVNLKGHYSPIRFLKRVAERLDASYLDVGRAFRAMRADMVLSEVADDLPSDVSDIFRNIAEEYLHSFRKGYEGSRNVAEVDKMWDRESIKGFYDSFFKINPTSQALRSWVPYEVEVLEKFYRRRLERGSSPSRLDKAVLVRNITDFPRGPFIEGIRERAGIRYDETAHSVHQIVLLEGSLERAT